MYNDAPEKDPSLLSVEMSCYEWHTLLGELERSMRVVNRDQTNNKVLYEKIATALSDKDVIVNLPNEPKKKSVDHSCVNHDNCEPKKKSENIFSKFFGKNI